MNAFAATVWFLLRSFNAKIIMGTGELWAQRAFSVIIGEFDKCHCHSF